jgi:hypothetical protein
MTEQSRAIRSLVPEGKRRDTNPSPHPRCVPLRQWLAAERPRLLRWLPVLMVLVAIGMGTLHAWVAARQQAMNEDGIAYLDMGDAFWRGDWGTAVSATWSPLYPWLLGLVMRVVQPPMRWEFPLVHLVNLALYLVALACFAVLWREVGRRRDLRALDGVSDELWRSWPDWAWWTLGYALFAWAALCLIEIWAVTPDMLMAALVFLSAAIHVRAQQGSAHWRTSALLGLLLGLSFLAKAIMFPIGVLLLGVSCLQARDLRQSARHIAVAGGVFSLIAGAYIGVVFGVTGRVTLGDAGRLTYVRYVNGLPYPHWQGGVPGLGTPAHPSRQILGKPAVYEFAAPIGGTYPIGQDPAYWYAGATPRLDLREQARTLLVSGRYYLDLFGRQQAGLVLAALVGYGLGGVCRLGRRGWLVRWGLALTALAAMALYGLVYVEGRYVAVFVVLLWADVLANVRWPASPPAQRVASWLSLGAVGLMLVNLLVFNLDGLGALAATPSAGAVSATAARPPSWPGEVAEALQAAGVHTGDRVGIIGYAFDSFWARLARVRIVAEMPGTDAAPFWAGDPDEQARVTAAFANAGVRAIVAEDVPEEAVLPGWQPLGQTNYALYLLRP